jgi:hypothetical protein
MRLPTLLTAILLLAPAGEALAHARLVKANPAVGSTVAAAPTRLWLKFNEVIRPAASGVKLTGPDGQGVVLSPLTKDPKDPTAVTAPTPANLAPGLYKVEWKALSPDGHHTQGDFAFTVRR